MSSQSQVIPKETAITCQKKCCTLTTNPYTNTQSYYAPDKFKKPKAGVFFYDENHRFLIVQSRGYKWGPPKGSMETCDDTLEDTAIREVMEETGLKVDKSELTTKIRIDRTTYFIIKQRENVVYIPCLPDNDASGIGWVHPDCLCTLNIELNSHCKILLDKLRQCKL